MRLCRREMLRREEVRTLWAAYERKRHETGLRGKVSM